MASRRRLKLASGVAAVLIVAGGITAAVAATRSQRSGHTMTGTQTSKEVYGTFGAFGITDGMRQSEVLARLGAPDKQRSGCLIYRVHGKTFHGFPLAPQLTAVDAVRYCIYEGVVSVIEDHWHPVNGVPVRGYPWSAPMQYYGCGGKPCHLQGP